MRCIIGINSLDDLAMEDGNNVILLKLVLSVVEGTGKNASFLNDRLVLSRIVPRSFSLREAVVGNKC